MSKVSNREEGIIAGCSSDKSEIQLKIILRLEYDKSKRKERTIKAIYNKMLKSPNIIKGQSLIVEEFYTMISKYGKK